MTNAACVAHLRARNHSIHVIKNGRYPTTHELLVGMPFAHDSLPRDFDIWCGEVASDIKKNPNLIPGVRTLKSALAAAKRHANLETMWNLLPLVENARLSAHAKRLVIYLGCTGDQAALRRLSIIAGGGFRRANDFDGFWMTAVQIGALAALPREPTDMPRVCSEGTLALKDALEISGQMMQANAEIEAGMAPTPADEDADFLMAVMEDRAEVFAAGRKKASAPGKLFTAMPVPKLPAATGSKKEIQRGFDGIAGKPLPLVTRGDIVAHRAALVALFPHAADVIDTILRDLSSQEPIRIRPTLLVGPPGCGKTQLALAFGEVLGLPTDMISLAGVSDAAVGGTSAQWYSARPNSVLQAIQRHRIANPLFVPDEVDKASSDRRNGSALDALLPLLEPGQASRHIDPALEVPCDLSWVSYIGTANDLSQVPAPLRDRMRVLVMPEPGWQHLGVLVNNIVNDLAKDRKEDPRWFGTLAQDELDLIRSHWTGSIRQLKRIVTIIVDGRETQMGRA